MERQNLNCDVLIVGGGVGGLACAAAVKERLPDSDVLVIEKQTAGYAGKANRGGGVLQYFDPETVKAEDFLKFRLSVKSRKTCIEYNIAAIIFPDTFKKKRNLKKT